MKLTILLTLVACIQVSAAGLAQTVTLSEKNASLEKIFREIKQQTGYDFFYQSELLLNARNVDIKVTNMPVAEALSLCFHDQPFTFTIAEKTILIRPKAPPAAQPVVATPPPPNLIRGRIVDDKSGEPVTGASVMVKDSELGVTTGREGDFSFVYNGNKKPTLVISHIGYTTKEVELSNKEFAGNDFITIRLAIADQNMAAVEITTGMFKRNRESFTGVVTSFTGDQLKVISNQNIIQSLKTLDPSFIVVENNRIGSNPNSLPTIELRGKTSLSAAPTATTTTDLKSQYTADPNLPLFVLNGFPSTLEIINNLDMNRVASITILKDAASTAIWGSKAANGVVVIETKKPIAGELRISYTGDFSVQSPDLSSYNLMNSAEKLEFERLAGVYDGAGNYTPYEGQLIYNQRLADVRRGVNTYWLSEPVQTGVTDHHSLQLTGGNNDLLFGASLSYQKETGVMKGSGKNSWGGNIDLNYRKGRLNITDQLYLSGSNGTGSPFGSFADFAATNPMLVKRLPDGSIPRYADSTSDASSFYTGVGPQTSFVVPNPLYNASLYSINSSNELNIQNNLNGIFTILPELWLQGGFQISTGTTTFVTFKDPDNTAFDAMIPTEKGAYTNDETRVRGYSGNLMLTYSKTLIRAHTITFNLRSDITQNRIANTGFKVIGFPEGTNGNPAFAFKYDPYSTSPASTSITRSFGHTGSLSYAYKMRYLMDLQYTLSGSNAFGSNNKYQPSWSTGLGWNLHREAFLKPVRWINQLALHGNIGVTGNELLGIYSSNSVYTAVAGSNIFGQSLDQTTLGNPNLQWQSTRTISTSMDFNILNNRVSGYLNYYVKNTDPLIVGATGILPSSVGMEFAYPINVGKLVYKGWEGNLRVSPIYKVKERIIWTVGVTGAKIDGKYGNFGNTLYAANKAQITSNGLVRYLDGYSPDDLWAVRSRGIDPATGREIFLKKNGDETFTYSADDIVRVGNSRPTIEGVISSTVIYKGLTVNAGIRYRLNGYQMNTALYNKVENISIQALKLNQDKRALYDRWKQPGDIAQFKGIALNDYTPISSRFIQKDSHLIGETFSVSYDFSGNSWLHMLRMQGLRVSLYTNDIFRLTSIKTERGLDYPFARSASFSIAASF